MIIIKFLNKNIYLKKIHKRNSERYSLLINNNKFNS